MFADVQYQEILLPLSISNHGSLQAVFNKYKDKLQREQFDAPAELAEHFESLRQKTAYYVL